MKIHELSGVTSSDVARAILRFESLFSCSLGAERSYRFTYPAGYLGYLDALGDSRCFAAEKGGEIIGMIGGAVLRLRLPDGKERPVVFCEEVKLVPAARRTTALGRLVKRFQQWVLARSDITISVVLDETPIKPTEYTGRIGLAPMSAVEKIMVVRVPCPEVWLPTDDQRFFAADAAGVACHRQLTTGRYAVLSDGAERRSVMVPVWLVHPRGTACCRLEDRRRVRRVIVDDGSELRPLFVGSFAFRDPAAALELIQAALRHAAQLGFTALRLAIPVTDFQGLARVAGPLPGVQVIPGAVYACQITTPAPWTLSGVEI